MKKQIKKAAALSIAAVMCTSLLAGCGSSTTDSTTSTGTASATTEQATTGSYTDYSAGFPEQVTIQIPVYDRGYEGWNPTDNYYTQWIQKEFGDKYNVNVEYVAIGRNTEVQDYMQMIAAHTAPDIIFHYDMPQAVSYYSEGAIQDVDYDELAFYAPNYWANMQETIETYGKLDGHNAFIFASREPIYYSYVTLIRQDWLDAVNMEMPTSLEELAEVGKAWQAAGLGTVGEKLWGSSFTSEYTFIGESLDPTEGALYLDLNIAPFTWDVMENFLRTYNQLYNDGVIDPEYYLVTDDAAAKSKFVSGEVGTYGFYITANTDVISSLKANDPNAEVAILPGSAKVPEGSHNYYYEYPPYGMIMGINADTTAEERAAVYMFLEWMNQDDVLFFLQNGIEGETYNLNEDGIAVPVSDYEGEAKLSPNSNKDYWCLAQEVVTYGDEEKDLQANMMILAPEGYEYLIQDAYNYSKESEEYGIVNTIFTKAVESSTEYSADLKALWQEASVACVTCAPEEFDSIYSEYSQEYLDAGFQEILDEKQALLDEGAYMKAE